MDPLVISGKNLRVDDVAAAAGGCPVRLAPAALPAIERSRAAVERLVAEGRIAYGITTGFGRFRTGSSRRTDQTTATQSCAAMRSALGRRWTSGPCAMPLVLQHPGDGLPGVRPLVVQSLIDLLNAGVHPRAGAGTLGERRRPSCAWRKC